ncbi:MAG: efflux RND transporter periplasmic adaptor subunit [Gammaproteobacteria bacterium]|nr:efflux RND transporter periplasmic adaptor subunit [Gammaproteobacteria bacterium]MCW8986699.1 efflux RND transporter periplasmic adaptor subunit [Gammaproteobacteria bacterium]
MMNKMNIVAVSLAAILLTAYSGNESKAAEEKEKKILYWVAPMDATYRRDEPGKSPMGMDLVPVYDEGGDGSTVKISPAVENNMGVRTAIVKRDKLWRRIDTVGYVGFDENKISHLHLRTKGWIEKLYVKSEGERVTKGQLLFEVYAPELVNAQEEYLQALRSNNRGLTSASQERLIALGISASQIKQLNKTRRVNQYVKVYARQDGIIAKLSIREGMFVTPSKLVMSLADLSSVWLLAEVFESQADWVRVGQSAEVTLSYLPGREWEGKVEYIYPSLDPKTRTLRVRLRFENKDESLKPNMFAKVAIYGGAKREVITIPREALIRTGNDQRVIISVGDGGFQARKVTAGIESGEFIEIVQGLSEGDKVVTSGQFLIDSEASLKASIARMSSVDKKEDEMDPAMDMSEKITGTAVLNSVMPAHNMINMAHDPIPVLDWPAMEMDFTVKKDVSLEGLSKGDKVDFELEKADSGYVVKSIQKSKNQE